MMRINALQTQNGVHYAKVDCSGSAEYPRRCVYQEEGRNQKEEED
jgi:hypothetical protein